MNRSVFSVIVSVLIVHLCAAEIVIQTSKPKHLTDLNDAAIDILMTCYGDTGNAVGIVGNSDGSVLRTLRSKYFISVVLINGMSEIRDEKLSNSHELQVFVIAANSSEEARKLMRVLRLTVWWNQYANFLFIDGTPDLKEQCSEATSYVQIPPTYGVLNTQFICCHPSSGIGIFNSNQFRRQAPPVWRWVADTKFEGIKTPFSMFHRLYRKGGQACEALNFPKTIDIGGWPVSFLSRQPPHLWDLNHPKTQKHYNSLSAGIKKMFLSINSRVMWILNNIVKPMNGTPVIVDCDGKLFYGRSTWSDTGFSLSGYLFSTDSESGQIPIRDRVFPLIQVPLCAVTKHTGHMSQLDKILSVVDRNSRIGTGFVYLITFLFFKFFIGQAVMPAVLNLVRLTCGTGLPKLPENVASTIYLAALFMFVVTLQGIFTGNLATLLTTTIAYKNVETRQDIAILGYTVYTQKGTNVKLAADPVLEGHIVEIPRSENCVDYVLREPMAACVEPRSACIRNAVKWALHISRDPVVDEFVFHVLTKDNALGRRMDSIMKRWNEHGLWYGDRDFESMRLLYLNDADVMKNTERRVMNLHDLCFAFVILAIGSLCSSVCFVGELVVCKIRLKIAKRRNRQRFRMACGISNDSRFSFPSLNLRFNTRRSFSKRR